MTISCGGKWYNQFLLDLGVAGRYLLGIIKEIHEKSTDTNQDVFCDKKGVNWFSDGGYVKLISIRI